MIFEDASRKRWKVTLAVFLCIVLMAGILISVSVYSFYKNSPIPSLASVNERKGVALRQKIKALEKAQTASKTIVRKRRVDYRESKILREAKQISPLQKLDQNIFLRMGFLAQGDPESILDTKKNIKNIDIIVPDWFTFTGSNNEITENINADLLAFLKTQKSEVFPRISNIDEQNNWQGSTFSTYIHTEKNRKYLSDMIVSTLEKYQMKGINLDFEALDPQARVDYLAFLLDLGEKMHNKRMYVTVDIPFYDDAFDYAGISKIVDKVVVMAYDENYAGGTYGPIASQDWFQNGVADILKKIPAEKAIIALGQYAYDWNVTKKTAAKSMGFDDAMVLADEVGADVETDKTAVNAHFSYKDKNGDAHDVWLLDGISLWNQVQTAFDSKTAGVGIWRLGLEDPSIWKFLRLREPGSFDPKNLSSVHTLQSVNFDGEGEILKVLNMPQEGIRNLTFDGKSIDYADYQKLPTSYEVQKFGHNERKNIAITFDDGPDPVYTPQILDVLKMYKVKSTFFMVGDQLQRYPDLGKRVVDEGHLIGNHTFMHPNLAMITPERASLELNSNQRLIESITGKQTLLFRAPYNTDSSPETREQLAPLYVAGKMGYIIVDADVDSMDYDKPGVDKIVENVVTQLEATRSNIIVMHDAGGDRTQTVAALKKLIPVLQAKGYNFINVDTLLGVPASSLMPSISFKEQMIVLSDKLWTLISIYGWSFIVILFFVSTIISVFRIVFLGYFVLKSHKESKDFKIDKTFQPFVSILVPAYNEEKVIRNTLERLEKSRYENYEVIVIDDGSTDDTAKVVEGFIAHNQRFRLVKKENGGKASALNIGFEEAKAEYIVTIDADTITLPETIENLVAPFVDNSVDAVCGNVNVGNVKNILTGFQAVEYITTQNYDRRAFDNLNCISVVPGATGAWRKSKVLEAGGYSEATLTEDADLTLTMLEHGAKIVYMPAAKSITEAPETVSALFKQRFRWSYGTFQCLWKHKKDFFKGPLGWVALPNMFIFQIIFPILSPIGDLVFILSLIRGDMQSILSGYLLFLLMDFAGSLMAFTIEKAPKRYLFFVLIQRFFYRQFMYAVTFKSIFAALKGRRHGWNKLHRTNSVLKHY